MFDFAVFLTIVPHAPATPFQRVQTLATNLFASNSIAIVASGNPDPVLAESTLRNQRKRLSIRFSDEKQAKSELPGSD